MKTDRVNLLPPDMRPPSKINQDGLLMAGFVLFLCFGALVTFDKHRQLRASNHEATTLQSQSLDLQKKLSVFKELQKEEQLQLESYELIKTIKLNRLSWSKVFKELSSITPENTWLISVRNSYEDGNHRITLTGETSSQQQMSDFYSALERSYYFRNLSMKFSEQLDSYQPPLFRFQFEVLIETGRKT